MPSDVGDVVEAVRRIVGRQQRRRYRRRAPTDRGWRWRIRRGSGDGPAGRPGLGLARRRAIERRSSATRRARRGSPGPGCGAPCGGIIPTRTSCAPFPRRRRPPATLSIVHRVERQAAGLRALVVAGDAVFRHRRTMICRGWRDRLLRGHGRADAEGDGHSDRDAEYPCRHPGAPHGLPQQASKS